MKIAHIGGGSASTAGYTNSFSSIPSPQTGAGMGLLRVNYALGFLSHNATLAFTHN